MRTFRTATSRLIAEGLRYISAVVHRRPFGASPPPSQTHDADYDYDYDVPRYGIEGFLWNLKQRGQWKRPLHVATITSLIASVFIGSIVVLEAGGVQSAERIAEANAAAATAGVPQSLVAISRGEILESFAPTLEGEQALLWNADNPVTSKPGVVNPFVLPPGLTTDYERAQHCLTTAIYYEAANEPGNGQQAVAQVIINRMRHPAYPKTICGVVWQGSERRTGCQFSFTCDGSLSREPNVALWTRARAVATAALNGFVAADVGNATHYHADYVAPYWAPSLVKVAVLGRHIFYRFPGIWGRTTPARFDYRGHEPNVVAASSEPALILANVTVDLPVMGLKETTPDMDDDTISGASRSGPSVVLDQGPVDVQPKELVMINPGQPPASPIQSQRSPTAPQVADPLSQPRSERRQSRLPIPGNW